jgi:hypothetical protein
MSDLQDPSGDNGHSAEGGSTSGSTGTNPPGAADETFGWTAEDQGSGRGADARATAERMLGQLQSMIDTIAVQAAPVARQIGAKAAELAAIAADRAGPLAHRAADATADASVKIAERSRTWAAGLRSHEDEDDGSDDPEAASRSSVAVQGADDATERAAQDDPAEGPRS